MEAAQLFKKAPNPKISKFSPGDTVRVNFRIREGERERIQAFQGVVIRFMNGKGPAANFTVRRITAGIGIERVFPLHSPLVESVEITRHGSVRRAKLYYLRGLQGRAARIKELNPAQRRRALEAAGVAEAEAAALAARSAEEAEELIEQPTEELEAPLMEEAEDLEPDDSANEPVDEPEEEPAEDAAPDEPVEEPAEEADDPPAEELPPEETEKE